MTSSSPTNGTVTNYSSYAGSGTAGSSPSGSPSRMGWRDRMRAHQELIETELHLDDDQVFTLERNRVLTESDSRWIRKSCPGFDRNGKFVKILLKKTERSYQDFCNFLRHTGQRLLLVKIVKDPSKVLNLSTVIESPSKTFIIQQAKELDNIKPMAKRFRRRPEKIRIKVEASPSRAVLTPEIRALRKDFLSLMEEKLPKHVAAAPSRHQDGQFRVSDRHVPLISRLVDNKAKVVAYTVPALIFHVQATSLKELQDAVDAVETGLFIERLMETVKIDHFQRAHKQKLNIWAYVMDEDFRKAREALLGDRNGIKEQLKKCLPLEEDWSEYRPGRHAVDVHWMEECYRFKTDRVRMEPGPMTLTLRPAIQIACISAELRHELRSLLAGSAHLILHRDKENRWELREGRTIKYLHVVLSVMSEGFQGGERERAQGWWLSADVTVEDAVQAALGWQPTIVMKEWSNQQINVSASLIGWWRSVRSDKLKVWKGR